MINKIESELHLSQLIPTAPDLIKCRIKHFKVFGGLKISDHLSPLVLEIVRKAKWITQEIYIPDKYLLEALKKDSTENLYRLFLMMMRVGYYL